MGVESFIEKVDKGLLGRVLNGALEMADKAIGALADNAAKITNGVVAGVSGIIEDGIGGIASGFTMGGGTREQDAVAEVPKLGGNARKQQNQAVDTSMYAASYNDIQVPNIGSKMPSVGVVMSAK